MRSCLLSLLLSICFIIKSYSQETAPAHTSSHVRLPLFVVETTIVGNRLFVDPDKIKSIDVLEGWRATIKYGDEGANGVIVIKAKEGAVFNLLGLEEILKINKADSLINKLLVVTVNKEQVDNVIDLKIDSSIVEFVKIVPITQLVKGSYLVQIKVKSREDENIPTNIRIRSAADAVLLRNNYKD